MPGLCVFATSKSVARRAAVRDVRSVSSPLNFTHVCDRCGRPLAEGEARYVAKIQVFAHADPLKISGEDLRRDRTEELAGLVEQCAQTTEAELMRDVFVEFKFDLCKPCQRAFIERPLPVIGT